VQASAAERVVHRVRGMSSLPPTAAFRCHGDVEGVFAAIPTSPSTALLFAVPHFPVGVASANTLFSVLIKYLESVSLTQI